MSETMFELLQRNWNDPPVEHEIEPSPLESGDVWTLANSAGVRNASIG